MTAFHGTPPYGRARRALGISYPFQSARILDEGVRRVNPIVRKTVAPDKAFTECRGLKARPHRRFACAKLEGTYAITRGARMEAYKQEFIKFMVESDVLKFGSFTLKSGRQSPFFMNAGAYVTGYQLKKLGEYYAQAIHDNFGDDFDVLFGPAYKGIPLAVVTAIAYHELYGKEVKYCCDRKEAKDHGADKGNLLGYEPQDGDRVVMVEDVTTSGKSIDETYPKVKAAADVEIKGLIVSLNRMEVG